jgi:Ala-tRNA(Pro) deacylase
MTHVETFFQFLADHQIDYTRHDHPPVYTVADVKRLVPKLPGAEIKNLFLRDKKGDRHLLVVVPADKRADIRKLPEVIGSTRLTFGSPERLMKYLGVEPGAVTLLAVFNDPDHAVEVFIDRDLWQATAFQFHPLVNTSTLVISRDNLQRFLDATGHKAQVVDIPGLE